MIGYLDRTFCCSPNCKNKCGRQLTDEVLRAAEKWWAGVTGGEGEGAPIVVAEFCDEEGNLKGKDKEEDANTKG